jgi:hypothetical protein
MIGDAVGILGGKRGDAGGVRMAQGCWPVSPRARRQMLGQRVENRETLQRHATGGAERGEPRGIPRPGPKQRRERFMLALMDQRVVNARLWRRPRPRRRRPERCQIEMQRIEKVAAGGAVRVGVGPRPRHRRMHGIDADDLGTPLPCLRREPGEIAIITDP